MGRPGANWKVFINNGLLNAHFDCLFMYCFNKPHTIAWDLTINIPPKFGIWRTSECWICQKNSLSWRLVLEFARQNESVWNHSTDSAGNWFYQLWNSLMKCHLITAFYNVPATCLLYASSFNWVKILTMKLHIPTLSLSIGRTGV